MSKSVLVELEQIQPNPYPMREKEDPAAVQELAINIARKGLMQEPTARLVDGGYQLVFGHTRKAAFLLLATKGVTEAGIKPDPDRWGKMPLVVREGLSEKDMFELAAAENLKRSDMNAIEVAKALRRYMDEFEATSKEAGELFGLEAATVRGKVRLLDLPADVQAKVATGEIPEVAARKLLTVQRVAPAAMVEASDAVVEGEDVEEVVSHALYQAQGVRKMWERWSSGKPKGGEGLWPLDTTPKQFPELPPPTWSVALKALGLESNAANRKRIEQWIAGIADNWGRSDLVVTGQIVPKIEPKDVELYNRLYDFMKPPACTACPFYAKANGNHYCGMEACHKRKKAAWMTDVLAKASKKLKIPIYDKAADGADRINLERWEHGNEFEKRHADIRLLVGSSPYNNFDGVPKGVRVIFVGAKAKSIKASRKRKDKETDWQEERRIRELRSRGINQLVWEQAVEHFLPAIQKLDNLAVLAILAPRANDWTGKLPAKNAARKSKLAWAQRAVVGALLGDLLPWQLRDESKCVEKAAKYLQGVAKEWGMKLPADWLQRAKIIQAAVSAETGAEPKSKRAK